MALEPTLGELLLIFGPFGAMQKKHNFLMPSWRLKNQKNRPKERLKATDRSRHDGGDTTFGDLGPWGGPARDQKVDRKRVES